MKLRRIGRKQLASLVLAISRLESHIEQLVLSLNLQVDGEENSENDIDWLFRESSGSVEEKDI
ncbi:hypothetical protein H6G93_36855 [Nostoc sp. FACHB-973]|nr:hypothetical protein [Nostoc sp. FACHB-973]